MIEYVRDRMIQITSNGLIIVLFVELNKLEKLEFNRNEYCLIGTNLSPLIECSVIASIDQYKNIKTVSREQNDNTWMCFMLFC